MKNFHAHLYFRPDREQAARKLYLAALEVHGTSFDVWKFHASRVGPHALPMIELHFNEATEEAAIEWLKQHHSSFSVLIHEDTGNDVRDHLENVRWLGNPLPIYFEFFDQVAAHPKFALHQPTAGTTT